MSLSHQEGPVRVLSFSTNSVSIVGAGTRLVKYSDHGATLKVGGEEGWLVAQSGGGGGKHLFLSNSS